MTRLAAPSLRGRVVPRSELSEAQRHAMYALLSAHFEGVSPDQFDRDLNEKNWAILLEDDQRRLAGFSTLLVYETEFEKEPVSVVYSGDTIVRRDAWGTAALPRTWIASVNQLRSRFPRGKYYWMLITSGFRTYRFLPLFWKDFYPRFDAPTPAPTARLTDHLARERFGDRYDAKSGIVRFERPQALVAELRGIPPERLSDPHVAFFAERNPNHALGDELVCLTELSSQNLTAAGRRMVR